MSSAKKPRRLEDIDLDADVAARLATAASRTGTTTPTRSRASYDLHPDTIAAIKELAAELEVPIRIVAQRLLDFALQAHERGELKLKRTEIVITRWGLE